jgi:uncharacterized damage-inducible protein DinB
MLRETPRDREHWTAKNIAILKQGIDSLAAMDDHIYTNDRLLPGTDSIGAHTRHCLEFYQCFLTGLEAGMIDYDQRKRDIRVQQERLFAAEQLKATIEQLARLAERDIQKHLLVKTDQRNESDDDIIWSRSSLQRELQFLLSHTIHHYAIIAMLLRLQGCEPGEEFGVAPSTLDYWHQRNAYAVAVAS